MSNQQSHEFLITYDISDNKKRRLLYSFLKGYGMALQKSVFLCSLLAKQHKEVRQVLNAIELESTEAIHCFQINEVKSLPSPTDIIRLSWIID